jgi:hypothetical protein
LEKYLIVSFSGKMVWEKFGTQTVNVQVTDPSQQNVVQQKSHITQQKHSSQNQACPGLCLCLEVGHDKHKQQERENDCQGQVEEEQLQYDPPRLTTQVLELGTEQGIPAKQQDEEQRGLLVGGENQA